MFSPRTKQRAAQVFLLVFILIKATDMHAFVHHDHPDEAKKCVLCQLSSRDNSTPDNSPGNQVDIAVLERKIFTNIVSHYEPVASEKPKTCQLFNKPPPFYTVSPAS